MINCNLPFILYDDDYILDKWPRKIATQSAWMSHKYREVLPVNFYSSKRNHDERVKFYPNSAKYRELLVKLERKLTERHKGYSNLALYHVENEYDSYCYFDLFII